jgi:hypothetical protein
MNRRPIGIVFVMLAFAACFSGVSRDEVARVTSPDGTVDAVLVEVNGGATTSFGYQVFLVPRGGKRSDPSEVADLYEATRNAHAYGADLRWRSANELVVEYLAAKSTRLRKPTIEVESKSIGVILANGVLNENAPAGGMLYNLRGRPYDSKKP